MKISNRSINKILRLYNIADVDSSAKSLRAVETVSYESYIKTSLIFAKIKYVILFGSSVDESTVKDLWPNKPEDAQPLGNPLDDASFSTPFQGKYVMVFKLGGNKQRLDIYLATEFDDSISRSLWQKYIKAGCITVNDEIAVSSRLEVDETDTIQVKFPADTETSQSIPILYEDEYVVALNKPEGMLTHAKGGIVSESTVADFMRQYTNYSTDSDRPGIIHRLDRATSGIILGARTKAAAEHLQEQFAKRKVKKIYYAIIQGTPKHLEAKIDLPIGRNPTKPSTFRIDSKGKAAQTTYKVLASHNGESLVRLEPRTGRTHQLRVHMAHIGNPIIGDRVYGKAADRMMLHAYELDFLLPTSDKKILTAPLPEAFLVNFPNIKL